ncbi:MAG TPA: co-chaperone GroES family protein [Bacteroidota bacterium]|nr:co-chaperone GroES family protein [Bacteroidota bacterium]
MRNIRKLLVVGDRVLVTPEDPAAMTRSGLYLPPSVQDREKIQSGFVVKVGPGYAMPNPDFDNEPWSAAKEPIKYIPLQVEEGDYVIFMKSHGIEVEFEDCRYIIVPHSAILLIVRNEIVTE